MRFPEIFESHARDFSDRPLVNAFLIDGEGTMAPEDAISIHKTEDGHYRVSVSVPDMATFLTPAGIEEIFLYFRCKVQGHAQPYGLQDIHQEMKGRAAFFVGEDVPSLEVSYTIHADNGRISDVGVSLSRTCAKGSFTFAERQFLMKQEKEFGKLFFESAKAYTVNRPLVIKDGGFFQETLSSGLKLIISSASEAMGMYAAEKNIPLIFAKRNVFLQNRYHIYNVFNSYAEADHEKKSLEKDLDPKVGKSIRPSFGILSSEFSVSPEHDALTSAQACVKFTSPFRFLDQFMNVLQISAHLGGRDYNFSNAQVCQVVDFLNRRRPSFDRALTTAQFPAPVCQLPRR